MQRLRFILILILLSNICPAQRTSETIYYAWIKKLDRTSTPKGHLLGLKGDHILHLERSKYTLLNSELDLNGATIPINEIEIIKIRKSNRIGKGIWKGALIGGGSLGLLAVISNAGSCSGYFCPSFSDTEIFVGGFILGMLPGAIIGGLIGKKTMKFYINGEKTSYEQQKEQLQKFLLNGS